MMRPVWSVASFSARVRPCGGRVKVALPSIGSACARLDEAFFDELLQDPIQALLGDPQDVEQFGNGESGLAIDEMQHPMVSASKIVVAKDAVGVAHEVAIGEEEQLNEIIRGALGEGAAADDFLTHGGDCFRHGLSNPVVYRKRATSLLRF